MIFPFHLNCFTVHPESFYTAIFPLRRKSGQQFDRSVRLTNQDFMDGGKVAESTVDLKGALTGSQQAFAYIADKPIQKQIHVFAVPKAGPYAGFPDIGPAFCSDPPGMQRLFTGFYQLGIVNVLCRIEGIQMRNVTMVGFIIRIVRIVVEFCNSSLGIDFKPRNIGEAVDQIRRIVCFPAENAAAQGCSSRFRIQNHIRLLPNKDLCMHTMMQGDFRLFRKTP